MRYIHQEWDEKYDGVLYFVQRLEEMLYNYSDDIVKAPVHNISTLILEYLETKNNPATKDYHLKHIADEITDSMKEDLILKEYLGSETIRRICDLLNGQKDDVIHYLMGMISFSTYFTWCKEYLKKHIIIADHKKEISRGLRSWVSSIIRAGYSSQYIYRYLHTVFDSSVEDPEAAILGFIDHFDGKPKEYRIYLLFMGAISEYRDLLNLRLHVQFEDDGNFSKFRKKDNHSFVGYLEVPALDPYVATSNAFESINILIRFYRVISNKKKDLIGKNCMAVDTQSNECIFLPVQSNGFNVIEVEPKTDLKEVIDGVIIACQNKGHATYAQIGKAINLHNSALRQQNISDGFVNLWSVLEVISSPESAESKIKSVCELLPILQNHFYHKYFAALLSDLRDNLERVAFKDLMASITQPGTDVQKIAYFVLLEEYEGGRVKLFSQLREYPNIRQKIKKISLYRKDRLMLFKISEAYAQRLKWHLHRLYRVRNGIVHAGESYKYTQVLGEHLHIYCDEVIGEVILKLAQQVSLTTISDVMINAKLSLNRRTEAFKTNDTIKEQDILLLLDDLNS